MTKVIDAAGIDERLYSNYLNQLASVREVDFEADRPHLTCEDVLDAHFLIGNHFLQLGEGIGGFGTKDPGLLSSAVARQVASVGQSYVYDDLWDIAATLLFGLINNHPFYDANKRTAFLASVFLCCKIITFHGWTSRLSKISRLK